MTRAQRHERRTHDDRKSGCRAGRRPADRRPLIAAAILIGLGNFLVVLDTTIANVSVPTIAGSLGVSSSQGTWVITSYAVAEAITVPLDRLAGETLRRPAGVPHLLHRLCRGLPALRAGQFAGMLLGCRVLLGLVGGPIMPLSQMLLLRVFPKEKATIRHRALGDDHAGGSGRRPHPRGHHLRLHRLAWIFFIKVPVAAGGGLLLI